MENLTVCKGKELKFVNEVTKYMNQLLQQTMEIREIDLKGSMVATRQGHILYFINFRGLGIMVKLYGTW